MNKMLVAVLLFLALWRQSATADLTVGQELVRFRNVPAYYNGSPVGNMVNPYQCVKYVRDFYSTEYGFTFGSIGEAKNMFVVNRPHGLIAHTNSQSAVPPSPGNILCFDGGPAGHVAIVKQVYSDHITIVEQNWSITGERSLNMSSSNGVYTVIQSGDTYWVQGWLHHPDEFVGHFSAGWRFDGSSQAIADAYNLVKNTGGGIGNPYNNGGTQYLHVWDPHGFLVQNFDGGLWGPCAIVMRSGWTKAYSLHGAFWWYFWYYNVSNGLPISEEYHDSNGNAYQDFENGISLKWDGSNVSEVSTSNLRAQGIVYVDDEIVVITLLPGNGTTLNVSAYALSSTQVYITGSAITNASNYAVYEDNIMVGYLNPTNLELTLDNRSPNSTHQYQVVAYDAAGVELLEFDSHFLRC